MVRVRPSRVGSLFRDELSLFLLREVEIPGVMITLTEVEVTDDLQEAVAKVSVLPDSRAVEVLRMLTARTPYFQFLLMKKIRMKPMPKLAFAIDHGPERAAAIEKALLKDNNRER